MSDLAIRRFFSIIQTGMLLFRKPMGADYLSLLQWLILRTAMITHLKVSCPQENKPLK